MWKYATIITAIFAILALWLPSCSSFLTRMFAGRTRTKAGGFIECRPHENQQHEYRHDHKPVLKDSRGSTTVPIVGIVVCTPGQTVTPSTNMCDVRQLCRPKRRFAESLSICPQPDLFGGTIDKCTERRTITRKKGGSIFSADRKGDRCGG